MRAYDFKKLECKECGGITHITPGKYTRLKKFSTDFEMWISVTMLFLGISLGIIISMLSVIFKS